MTYDNNVKTCDITRTPLENHGLAPVHVKPRCLLHYYLFARIQHRRFYRSRRRNPRRSQPAVGLKVKMLSCLENTKSNDMVRKSRGSDPGSDTERDETSFILARFFPHALLPCRKLPPSLSHQSHKQTPTRRPRGFRV